MKSCQQYTRQEWFASFGSDTGQGLSRSSVNVLQRLAGTNETLAAEDIQQVYLPLVNLILQHFHQHLAVQKKSSASTLEKVFIVGITGSVAVGKSTGARLVTELIRREEPNVELITTDHFLKPNHVLEEENLLKRKGFPESYDQTIIQRFVQDLAEQSSFSIPIYDHIAYTILPNTCQTLTRPKILVLEGVNVLQDSRFPLDYRLYFDAAENDIQVWYVQRFLTFRRQAFSQPGAYFQRFATLSDNAAIETANLLWQSINLINLHEYIAPTRTLADCIISKQRDHRISHIQLRHLFTD